MRTRTRPLLCAAALLSLAGWAVRAQVTHEEKTVPDENTLLREMPAQTIATLMSVSNYARIDKVDRVTQGDSQFFVASWTQSGHGRDASITADGLLMETNEQLGATDAPPAVRKAAEEFFKGEGKLSYARKTMIVYVVRGPLHNRDQEIVVSATGEVEGGGGPGMPEGDAHPPATGPGDQRTTSRPAVGAAPTTAPSPGS